MATYNGNSLPVGINLDEGDIINFDYSGSTKSIALPLGTFKIECWGAQGRGSNQSVAGGAKGAYVKGILNDYSGTLYIQTGGIGGTQGAVGGYNGGGNGGGNSAGSGGGSSDVRVTGGLSTNIQSLRSRIIVAGASGGIYNSESGYPGGELTATGPSTGATQTAGGKGNTTAYDGSFGKGANSNTSINSAGGGGSGYYGGGVGNNGRSGGGGNSFISGHPGCNAVNENGVHTGQSIHYSGLYFTETQMLAGNKTMPNKSGSGTSVGNQENGYVRITIISLQRYKLLVEDNGVLKSYSTGGGDWVTI